MAAASAPNQVAASQDAATCSAGVTFEDVHFAYEDGTKVVDGISLRIETGTTVGIVGPSGCGKSTLLGLVAALLQPTSGFVERRAPEAGRHPLAMVFQRETLLPWLTAEENVRMYALFGTHGIPRSRLARALSRSGSEKSRLLDSRVGRLLESVGLADAGKKYPYQLSGGMRRRLAFLTAVAPDPQILLLDEPFSSVDEPTRVAIHQDVYRITRSMGMTTVLVTHDLAEAVSLCDRVVILTNRPTRIARDLTIDFGPDRVMMELRETPTFLELYGKLWHDLRAQIAASDAVPEETADGD